MPDKVKVTLVKSTVSHTARTRSTVRALGLHKIGDSVEIADTPEMRGMTRAVRFLLHTEDVGERPAKAAVKSQRRTLTAEAHATPEPAATAEPAATPEPAATAEPAPRPRARKTKEEASK
jgi:large subunit ribosomal protein L30